MATRRVAGTASWRSSSHLAASPGWSRKSPVMFPPGWARLRANPAPMGSLSRSTATIGIVLVASLAARTAAGPTANSTSTWRSTSSATSLGKPPDFPPANRTSSTIWPSPYPSLRRPRRVVSVVRDRGPTPATSTPSIGTLPAGCASTASGAARSAAAPARNARRSITRSPGRLAGAA